MPEQAINLLKGDKVDSNTDYLDALPVNVSGVVREILGASGYMLQQPGLTAYGQTEPEVVDYVTFDGSNDYLSRSGALTGATNTKVGTIAARVRLAGTGNRYFFQGLTGAVDCKFQIVNSTNVLLVRIDNVAGSNIAVNIQSSTGYSSADGWINILISWNCAASEEGQLYVNDVNDYDVAASDLDDEALGYAEPTTWGAFAQFNNAAKYNGDVAFLWFSINDAIDFSNEDNRRLFFNENGSPADLGPNGENPTGTAPLLYFAGNVASFPTNKGTGGAFTLTGDITGGTEEFPTGYGLDRGGIWNSRFNQLYRVSGDAFMSIDADGTGNDLGTVSGSDQASLAYSFNTQAIVADGKYWLYDPTNGFRQVTDPDLGNPIDIVWVDGYYFFTDGDFLYHTDLVNESSIDPLKFATSEFSPDPTLGLGLTVDNKVIAFNRYTTEFFVNQAFEQFAFQRLPSRNVMAGIVGTHAKIRLNGVYYFVGGSKESDVTVMRLDTGAATPLGSRAIDKIINSYTESQLSTCVMDTRTVDDYPYLIVNLPNHTLLFNFKVAEMAGVDQAWTILKSDVEGDNTYRAINGVLDPRRSQWTYGDKREAILTYLDSSVATHAGELAECIINTPFIYLETASVDQLTIQTIPGFTVTDDATVFLSLTYDGVTYSQEHPLEYGTATDYTKRFIARRLGYIRNFFGFRFRWASLSRMAFATAWIKF